ncbi:MAG: hypothetical protein ACI9LO_001942 [Planctomycetota bacterium]
MEELPVKDETKQTNQGRRDFIKKSGLIGAGVVAATVAGTGTVAATTVEVDEKKGQKGYELTEHVAAYYKSALI